MSGGDTRQEVVTVFHCTDTLTLHYPCCISAPEWRIPKSLSNYQFTRSKKQLQKAISLYNNDRLHMSIGNLTPNQLHNNQKINHQRLWKNYFKKKNTFENKNENLPVNLLQDLSINL
jgi:hypothetical protein